MIDLFGDKFVLFGYKLDSVTLWTAAIAVLTLALVLVAWRQLRGIRATSQADFTLRFIDSFFTAEVRTMFTLLSHSALTYEAQEIVQDGEVTDRLPYLRIDPVMASQIGGIVSPPNRIGYPIFEVDDLLLGQFEALGLYVRRGLIDFYAAWTNFSVYLIDTIENPEIEKYLTDPEEEDDVDTYSELQYLYRRFQKYDRFRGGSFWYRLSHLHSTGRYFPWR
jgi:hypothetical protein